MSSVPTSRLTRFFGLSEVDCDDSWFLSTWFKAVDVLVASLEVTTSDCADVLFLSIALGVFLVVSSFEATLSCCCTFSCVVFVSFNTSDVPTSVTLFLLTLFDFSLSWARFNDLSCCSCEIPSLYSLLTTFCVLSSLFISAVCASELAPKMTDAPIKIDVIPTENFLMEYLFWTFEK